MLTLDVTEFEYWLDKAQRKQAERQLEAIQACSFTEFEETTRESLKRRLLKQSMTVKQWDMFLEQEKANKEKEWAENRKKAKNRLTGKG